LFILSPVKSFKNGDELKIIATAFSQVSQVSKTQNGKDNSITAFDLLYFREAF
jgi:hypothetical protein